ncbi:cytochrome P450 [Acidiferrimicrobium sp. IK]|uniref:cytochrome P450 n=1 Tax=Acidiferrimicrobium sp. IK TaxID=2871700 RepID=UPI0021CB6868|nr:cytochrome P450 [Acidiferrimicrobium sp. IK]MCU4186855.1 cytochrome P450 [Acidiferrimicrobium sp. IK]
MTTVDTDTSGGAERGACPVVHYDFTGKGAALSHLEALDRLREMHPVVRSTFGEGFWVLTDSAGVREALQKPGTFSSSIVVPYEPDPPYKWIPEMLDPPEHTRWRQLLSPHFTPKAMEALDQKVRTRCVELIEPLVERGHCDFLEDFAWRFPTSIFLDLMGLPVEDLDRFMAWEHAILHNADQDADLAVTAMFEVMGYFQELIADRRQSPRDDLLSTSLTWQIDGAPIPEDDLLSWCLLMFMAGLDTVSIQLAYSFWHLGSTPADRERIVADPAIIPSAIEELLRVFSFVAPGRKVTEATEISGCPMADGDRVMVALGSANRDPKEFDRPTEVVIDRSPNNHVAFGLGPHRCLGSHLARRELRIALEEWHARIPDYRIDGSVEVVEHGGMFGLDSLALRWD